MGMVKRTRQAQRVSRQSLQMRFPFRMGVSFRFLLLPGLFGPGHGDSGEQVRGDSGADQRAVEQGRLVRLAAVAVLRVHRAARHAGDADGSLYFSREGPA